MFHSCFPQRTASSVSPAKEARWEGLTSAAVLMTAQLGARSLMTASASSSPGKVTALSVRHSRKTTTWWEEPSTGGVEEVEEDEGEEVVVEAGRGGEEGQEAGMVEEAITPGKLSE